MKTTNRFVSLFLLLIAVTLGACVGGKSTIQPQEETKPGPAWFTTANQMQADSLYYRLDATVLHSDSAKAIELAKESAVAYLLTQLDEQNEQQRLQLVNDEGLNALSSAPFILQLRRFTSYKDDIEVAQSMAQSRGDIYQGYVRVRLSKTSYRSQLRTFLDRATTNSNRDAWMDLISE